MKSYPHLSSTLAFALSFTVAFQPFLAFGQSQATIGPVQAQLLSQDNPIKLLEGATMTSNANEAHAILNQARSLLANESLPPDYAVKIQNYLNLVDQQIQDRADAGKLKVDPTYAANLFNISNNLPVPANQLQSNLPNIPALRSAMWEISQGQVTGNSMDANFSNVVQSQVGTTPQALDAAETRDILEGMQPGGFITLLEKAGLVNQNFTALNNALRNKYQGASLETLSQMIIDQSAKSAGLAGMGQTTLAVLTKNRDGKFKVPIIRPDGFQIDNVGFYAGMTPMAFYNFIINANLILQMADLWGIQLSQLDKDVNVLLLYGMMRAGVQVGARVVVQNDLNRSSKIFAHSQLLAGTPGLQILYSLLRLPFVSKLTPKREDINPNHVRVTQEGQLTPGAIPPVSAAATTESVAADKPAATDSPTERPRNLRTLALKTTVAALQVLWGGGWSFAETRAIGQLAMTHFRNVRQEERKTLNDLFRLFLLEPQGEGFLKLMILSMNVGKPVPSAIDIVNPKDAKVAFILNLARSAKECSPTDLTRWQALSKMLKKSKFARQEAAELNYACSGNLDLKARFARIQSEFETFGEIKPEVVAALRGANRDSRLRMGELLLQLQFLNGDPGHPISDRTPEAQAYFSTVIEKYLGFTKPEDIEYFNLLHSFIVQNGGMVVNAKSPTGYTIGNNSIKNPYDMSVGYIATNGPEASMVAPDPATLPATVPVNQPGSTIPGTIQPTIPTTPGTALPSLPKPGTIPSPVTIPTRPVFTPWKAPY